MRTSALALAIFLLLAGARAQADDDPPRPFGAQVVLTDLGMLALGGIVAAQTQQPLFVVGTYALGAPLVHVYHEDYGGSAISFALHATLPLGLGYLLYKGSSCANDELSGFCDGMHFFLGATLGVIAATTIDALAFSPPPFLRKDTPTTAVVPVALRGGFALQLSRRF
jgi:hypothetical protein